MVVVVKNKWTQRIYIVQMDLLLCLQDWKRGQREDIIVQVAKYLDIKITRFKLYLGYNLIAEVEVGDVIWKMDTHI